MKNINRFKATAIAVAIAGSMLVAGAAQAALTVSTSSAVLSSGGTVASNLGSGGGGIFEFTRSGGNAPTLMPGVGNKFVGICLELNEGLANIATYDFVGLEAAPVNGSAAGLMSGVGVVGATRGDDLRYLLGHVYPVFGGSILNDTVVGITSADKALALQMAVWEISQENAANGYNLTTGVLQFTNPGSGNNAFDQAKIWLAALNTGWAKLDNVFAIVNQNKPGQDFVVQAVPIPAAAWLLGSGLLGLFGLARRKQVAA